MKKRVSGLLIALAMVALVVAGCSNNDKKEEKKDRAEADIEWQMISPEDMKKVLETEGFVRLSIGMPRNLLMEALSRIKKEYNKNMIHA